LKKANPVKKSCHHYFVAAWWCRVPVSVIEDALHEQVRDPQAQEEVTGAVLLGAGVLAQIEERKDVGVPRLEIDGK